MREHCGKNHRALDSHVAMGHSRLAPNGGAGMTAYRTTQVNGAEVFYREGGDPAAATLLLHGFPSSSAQYQRLMERLEERYHVVARLCAK